MWAIEKGWVLSDLVLWSEWIHVLSTLSTVNQVLPVGDHFFDNLQLFLVIVEHCLLFNLFLFDFRDFPAAVFPF